MNVSRIGFSGNYCIKTGNEEQAKFLGNAIEGFEESSKKLIKVDGDKVYIATDNMQWSRADYSNILISIKTACMRYESKNGKDNNPFGSDSKISRSVDDAFCRQGSETGFIAYV